MEYVPGARDLEAVVGESGPLSPPETARIGLALIDALAAGHELGILHRDVKPSNVLLTTPEPQGAHGQGLTRALLSDYGISLQQDADEPRLTTASGIIGTPGFLAPERARGSAPTPASDLFSLGSSLYFAVEGHGPFDRSSYVATLTALLTEEPAPPQRADNLAPVLLKLLAKDPAQRLRADDAAALLHQLTPAPQQTITQGPRALEQPPIPQPPARSPAPPPPSRQPHEPQAKRRAWPPWRRPGVPAGTSHRQLSRQTRRIIAGTAAVLVVGIGTWVAVASLGGPDKLSVIPSPTPSLRATRTSPVMPYGDAVGLTKELHPGDCVSAAWTAERFKGLPNLGTLNCTTGLVDGQVINTAPASSLDDAQKNGDDRCKQLLADTVNAMADARSYALPPSKQGWENGVRSTACLIFNKSATLGGYNVGPFREIGEQTFVENDAVGDCYNVKETVENFTQYFAQCGDPHDVQVVGFAKASSGRSYAAERSSPSICAPKYASAYSSSSHDVRDILPDENSWKQGFHYVECIVYRPDGKKLTSDLVRRPAPGPPPPLGPPPAPSHPSPTLETRISGFSTWSEGRNLGTRRIRQ
jgi:Serine/threonine protein kinase